jgi:hypothetical protein
MMKKAGQPLMWLLISALLVFILACQGLVSGEEIPEVEEQPSQPETVAEATNAPSPVPPEPTETPEPQAIPASQESIEIGEFSFGIVKTASEGSVMGMKPNGMKSNDRILFVEFELLSGDRGNFEGLELSLEDASGVSSDPIALITSGQIRTLTSMSLTGESTFYKPNPENVTWAFVAAKNVEELYLVFPGGEKVDLSPLLK